MEPIERQGWAVVLACLLGTIFVCGLVWRLVALAF